MSNDVIHTSMRFGKRIVPGGVAILVLLFAAWARNVQLALGAPQEAAAVPDIPMAPLAPGQRIDAAIAVEPKKVGPSKSVGLFVKLRIAPGFTASSAVPPGKHKISIKVSFQMCNEAVCWPPQKITRVLELEIPPAGENK